MIAGLIDRRTKKVPTVANLYRQYVDAPGNKPCAGTLTAYAIAFRRRINPTFGDKPVDAVTLADLEASIAGVTYDPAKDVKDLMSLLFRRALADGYVQVNPVPLLRLPAHNAKETVPWSPSEIEKLWHAYGDGDRIASACLLMIYTGMMPGELFLLKPDMIDWEAHTIIGCGRAKCGNHSPVDCGYTPGWRRSDCDAGRILPLRHDETHAISTVAWVLLCHFCLPICVNKPA